MVFSMIWPIILIVLSNVFYNICSKEIPSNINPFASLTITYLIGAAISLILYYTINRGGNLIHEYKNVNWSSFILGIAIVGLEVGTIYIYKAGWDISKGQIVHSILLAICLVIVGALYYHEIITGTKVAGILICMLGLYIINK